MLQNPRKTLGFKKNMVYKIPPGGGGRGKPYPASGLQSIRRSRNCNWLLQTVVYSLFDVTPIEFFSVCFALVL